MPLARSEPHRHWEGIIDLISPFLYVLLLSFFVLDHSALHFMISPFTLAPLLSNVVAAPLRPRRPHTRAHMETIQ